MDRRIRHLIVVGACVTSNCRSCLDTAVSSAREGGVDDAEIMEAIAMGIKVRQGAINSIDQLVATIANTEGEPEKAPEAPCECRPSQSQTSTCC